ncbi:probable trehalose-phosphate phosphatase D [Brassica rapa]|uniref:probable trehalose-phosphate phosphatase D n=1 Tax=Brassica campestris TaxID=3711 RepID=UPI00142E4599|nr:probable trehalose-phosphate phosphatase D [Brassica rapa]
MTNHNAFMSDAKGNISLAVRVPVSSQSLFSPSGGRCISIPRKKLLQKIEAVPTQTRIDSWIETMRASSPSRTRPGNISSLPELDEEDEYSSWMAQHPSALSKFEEIAKSSTGKQIVMFLDYDGTLSPIVENPDQAYMTDEMRDAVKGVARYFPTAIVTGRCRDKVRFYNIFSQSARN